MASDVNTDGFQNDRYFARSWALLTRDRGWVKPILTLWLASIVPILGPLGVSGYIAEWARLTAWGVSSSPKQSDVQIFACIKSGWRVFLVNFIWRFFWVMLVSVLVLTPFIGVTIPTLSMALNIVLALIIRIAVLRATIYQNVSGGLRPGIIFKMVENDAGGLLRIFGINLIGVAILGVIAVIIGSISILPAVGNFIAESRAIGGIDISADAYDEETLRVIATFVVSLIPAIIGAVFFISLFANVLEMVVMTALGLWMRQYNVPAWGSIDDPLPDQIPATHSYSAQTAYAPSPYAPEPIDDQQVPYAYGDTDYGQSTHGNVGDAAQGPDQRQ